MVRKFGRGIVVALLFAAGCEDGHMNLLPPPPPAAAGTGGSTMAGTAGHTPGGDGGMVGGNAGMGGSAAGGMGGSGAVAGTGNGIPCPPGTSFGTICCRDEPDCSGTGYPFCAYGQCVKCVSEHGDQPQRGCATNENCVEDFNGGSYCVPYCTTDPDCAKRDINRPVCDHEHNWCVQCTGDEHCQNGNGRRKHCQTQIGVCVECTTSNDCDVEHPICGTSGAAWGQCVECTTSDDCVEPGRHVCSMSDQLHNVCVECTRNEDKACEENGQVCNEFVTRCVDCLSSQQCTDPTAPICRPDGECDACVTDDECGPGNDSCQNGQCVGRSQDPQPQP